MKPSCVRSGRLLIGLAAAWLCVAWPAGAPARVIFKKETPLAPPPVQPAEDEVHWHDSLKDAYAAASKARRPVLVVVGAEWCGPCKVLEKEMEKPEVAKVLARWVLVHLDVDHSEGAAAMLQGGGIPVLRILAPTGRRMDVKEGAMTGADLVAWLDAKYEEAVAAAADELLGTGAPDAASLAKLVKLLAEPDASLSEAAIKRLAPYPAVAAGAVVEAFAKGNLATRLACLELLTEWKAPVAGIDPWQPETVTNDRLKALLEWSAKAASAAPSTRPAATKPVSLSPEALESARREIARMVAASTDEEARAQRERLARYGAGIAGEVAAELKDAATDAARERLLALRYRLAASDALVLNWPGGIERLASASVQGRRAAAEELVARAAPADGPLLLELFADADALVREISLRGLRAAGKGDAARALLKLLADPDMNVRAAVLKELAQSPSPAMLNAVVEFARKETDADLVVHAVRVLRESKSERAIDGLTALLGHENWRVRAETAEGLAEMASSRGGMSLSVQRQADIYAAMVKLLEDPDSFVVSRAVTALAGADAVVAVAPMAKAVDAHPELAGEVVKNLGKGEKTKSAAIVHLRKFCFHKDERVRSEAIAALCAATGEVEKEMKALLKDEVVGVRMWAAASLFSVINSWRPEGGTRQRRTGGFFGFGETVTEEKIDPWQWTTEFRAGKERPQWMADVLPDLEALSKTPGAETQIDGALPQLALGSLEKALETIKSSIRAEPRLIEKAAAALPWLPIEQRLELFKLIVSLVPDTEGLGHVASEMAIIRDPRAADALWDPLARPAATIELAQPIYHALAKAYYGNEYGNSSDDDGRKKVIDATKSRLASGSEMQRLVSLALLLAASLDDAKAAGLQIFNDKNASPELRCDGFRCAIMASRKADGAKMAVAGIADPQPDIRSLSLRYLTGGTRDVGQLRERLYVNYNNPDDQDRIYYNQQAAIVLDPPPGLTVQAVRPLLKGGRPGDDARAGYLLALLGEREGMDALIRLWRKAPDRDPTRRMTYRAIAALKDEQFIPVLEEIFKTYEDETYNVREFYWTIRGMTGEKALLLRKKIRDQVGMDQLR